MKPFDRMVLVGASLLLMYNSVDHANAHHGDWIYWLSAATAVIWALSATYQFVMLLSQN